jgi:hypothetical protein
MVPVESLFQHERTLPDLIRGLILEFKNWTQLRNPIIVDENNIVLDGNHRASAFRELKLKHILVCKIDYFHERANLRYWFRLLKNIKDLDSIRQIVEGMNGRLQQVKDKESLRGTLERNRLYCGIQQGNFYGAIYFHEEMVSDAVSAYDVLQELQDRLVQDLVELEYIPCDCVDQNKFCGELRDDEMVIWTPQITKEMVVEAAKKEKLFAPKTTRHLIPARPLNVNVPTHWFKESISSEEINKRFLEFARRKKYKRFGPGQVIDGRYYGEELFVFFEKS